MRGKPASKRDVKPDHVYNSVTVAKFINYIMLDGKKEVARNVVYAAMDKLAEATKENALVAFEQALKNVRPRIEVRSRRVGGANLQVPTPVSENRALALTFRWIIAAARSARKSTAFADVLAAELINAYNGEGSAIRKKEEVQRMAEANRAFAHFAN